MRKVIALCGVSAHIVTALERNVGYHVLCFTDESERRGDVKLAYYLRDGPAIDLTIVGYSGAVGLAACDYLREQSKQTPILWLCDREEFESEAKRLGVNFCRADPSATEQAAQITLRAIKTEID